MSYNNKYFREIYFNSPYFIKNLESTLFGMAQRKKRYGDYFEKYFKLLLDSQYWESERLQDYQELKIEETIKFSKNIEGYKSSKSDNIKDFPFLTKQQIRTELTSYYNPNLKTYPCVWSHSSGTTGQALVFPITVETFQREYAFRAVHYSWAGVSLTRKDKIAMVSGHPVAHPDKLKPPFWVHDYANNWLLFSSYHMNPDNMRHYISKLDSFKPKLIHGYPSSIYLLSKYYKKYGSGTCKLSGIFTASETLLDFQRYEIENAFQTKVYNWYGNSEMTANIVECEKGELHLKHEHSYVEILKEDDTKAKPGESGRLVCTAFTNEAFPLIRYDIGDIVKISSDQISKCGRNGLLIDSIEGRKEDYILTPDGRMVGRLDHIFKDTMNVIEAQLYQENVKSVELRIVVGEKYTSIDERKILAETRLRLGNDILININVVPAIERGANNKFRFIVSKINQSTILNYKNDPNNSKP